MELLLIMRHSETGEILAEKTIENPRRSMFLNPKWFRIFDDAQREELSINRWNEKEL